MTIKQITNNKKQFIDLPSILLFYKQCGFELSHCIKNFFTDNYDHLMFEERVQLVDMIRG